MSVNNVNWQLVFQLVSALRHLGHDSELFERTAQKLHEEMQKFGWRPMAECPARKHVLVSFDHPESKESAVSEARIITFMGDMPYLPAHGRIIKREACHGWMPLPEPPQQPTTSKNE